jgi:hypothetical protein
MGRSAGAREVAAVAAGAQKSLKEIEILYVGLAQQQEALRQAFNQNHLAYSQALGAVDGHIAVIRAVMNDLQRGDLQLDEGGNIDWNVYYTWYNDMVAKEQAEAAAEDTTEQVAEEEVFGGDYDGSGVRQVPEGEQDASGEEAP